MSNEGTFNLGSRELPPEMYYGSLTHFWRFSKYPKKRNEEVSNLPGLLGKRLLSHPL